MNIDSTASVVPTFIQPTYSECFAPPVYPMEALHTQHTTACADQPLLLYPVTPMDESKNSSPTLSNSGSSAQNSSECTDEDIFERNQELSSTLLSSSGTSLEDYSSILDASPIFVFEPSISYGADRLVFIEHLVWDCTSQFYSIYGELNNDLRPPVGHALETLVHDGLVHGLCNEIVILPIMAAIQASQGDLTQHQADHIPFPLFVAEMLRRMRASYFLFRTAMQYVLDIERQIRMARERSKCGWCLSGVYGCDHCEAPERSVASRFSKGRTTINRKPKSGISGVIPASHFTKSDPLFPLADPRKAFLGALILANKFHRDRSIGNKSWATLIGLSLEEVHGAERAVGQALGWTLSRPWVHNEKDATGAWKPGPTHSSFAEPLFATTDAEVDRYGVKELRDKADLPPPLKSTQIPVLISSERTLMSSVDPDGTTQSFKTLRRSRSQTILSEDRRIAPLPHRQQSLNQTSKMSNPIKKASSAPFVLQPFASGYGDGPPAIREEMVDSVMFSEWCAYPHRTDAPAASADGWMDATPTIDQFRSKRKASQDFGPTALFRRGKQGQRMPVRSPKVSDLPSSNLSSSTSNEYQWDMCETDEDVDGLPPGLSVDTPTASSPSVGPLTRTNTPASLDIVAMSECEESESSTWNFRHSARSPLSNRMGCSYSVAHQAKLTSGSFTGMFARSVHQ